MKKGDFVRISYTGRIKESGELFDTTDKKVAEKEGAVNPNFDYEPVAMIVGEGWMIKGLEKVFLEMKVGEKREIIISPEEGFGQRQGNLIKTFSEREFKKQKMTPYPGMIITLNGIRGRILSAGSGRVRVDFNHPLAGKTLMYELKVEEQITKKKDKVEVIVEHYLGKNAKVQLKVKEVEIKIEEKIPDKTKEDIKKELKKYVELNKINFVEVEKKDEKKRKESNKT